MALDKDDALVLGRIRFRESSLLVTLFAAKRGPVKVIAKGARKARSRFGGSLEPTNLVHAVYYRKENRDLHLLSQCDVVRSFQGIRESLLRLAYGYAIIECLLGLKREESAAASLLAIAIDALAGLESVPEWELEPVLWRFVLSALDDAGYRPELSQCLQCRKRLRSGAVRFDARVGGVVCRIHGGGGFTISSETRGILESSWAGDRIKKELPPRVVAEGRETLRRFLLEHGLGRFPFRSLEQLVPGS